MRGLLRGTRLAGRTRSGRAAQAAPPSATPPSLARLPRLELAGGLVLHTAATMRTRLVGLLGVDSVPASHGLLIPRTRSVHTLGMRPPLDLVWLDESGDVV